MSRFLRIEGENVWVNVLRVDVIAIRPQLVPVSGQDTPERLEELHETTGRFEVVASFDGRVMPVRTFPTQADAEDFVTEVLAHLS